MANELYTIANGRATLHPHGGQSKALRSDRRFVFVIAGTQGGKTSFLPWWLEREIRRKGAGDYLAVTATYDLFKLKFLPEMQGIFCNLFGWKYAASERVIYRGAGQNLTRIILRSAESDGGLESATAKAAVLDECGQDRFSLQAWEAVQRRLTLHQGRVLGATTPYNMGWLKTEVYDRWRGGDTDYQVIQFPSTVNPRFPRDEYERARRTLPAWKFEMFYRGNFSRPAGMIYGDFNEIHRVKRFPILAEWPRYVGIDPGPNHTAVLWAAEDTEKKCIYVYREYLEGDRTTQQHIDAVNELSRNERVISWALGQKSEKQYRLDWQAGGLPVAEPPIHEVDPGIDRVIELLKTYRLFVFDDLVGLIDQFGTYSRKTDDSGQPTEDIKDKEKYHFLDALRYLVLRYANPVWFI
jgi:hypothetical protein